MITVRTVLNIIWLLLCGIWMALGYVVAGVICCLLIVTIPFGIASFRIGNYALWPFGRSVVKRAGCGCSISVRQHRVDHLRGLVARDRARADGDRARGDDHRDTSCDREPQTHPG